MCFQNARHLFLIKVKHAFQSILRTAYSVSIYWMNITCYRMFYSNVFSFLITSDLYDQFNILIYVKHNIHFFLWTLLHDNMYIWAYMLQMLHSHIISHHSFMNPMNFSSSANSIHSCVYSVLIIYGYAGIFANVWQRMTINHPIWLIWQEEKPSLTPTVDTCLWYKPLSDRAADNKASSYI